MGSENRATSSRCHGVDSLVALEVRNWITPEIQANMAPLDILAAVPMETFAAQIYAEKQTCGGLGIRE